MKWCLKPSGLDEHGSRGQGATSRSSLCHSRAFSASGLRVFQDCWLCEIICVVLCCCVLFCFLFCCVLLESFRVVCSNVLLHLCLCCSRLPETRPQALARGCPTDLDERSRKQHGSPQSSRIFRSARAPHGHQRHETQAPRRGKHARGEGEAQSNRSFAKSTSFCWSALP